MKQRVTVFIAGTNTPFDDFEVQDFEITEGGTAIGFEHDNTHSALWPINGFVYKFVDLDKED